MPQHLVLKLIGLSCGKQTKLGIDNNCFMHVVNIVAEIDNFCLYQVQSMKSQSHIQPSSLMQEGSMVLRASASPGNLLECKFLGLIQHLLNLRFWEWGSVICALQALQGFDAHLNLRTTALVESV